MAVQLLTVNERVLVLGDLVGVRNSDDWFTTTELSAVFEALRLPAPSQLSRSLGRLEASDKIRDRSTDHSWALTPQGRQRVAELLGDIDYGQIQAELVGTPGADYAFAKHAVIPPSFAPPRWQVGIERLLRAFPFEKNVFCMTRFPKSDGPGIPDRLVQTIVVARTAVAQHGLTLHLASDRQGEDDLFGNVGAYMWACQYGIGLLEDPSGRGLNSNMLIELGSMLITGRRCAFLKDKTSPAPPADLSGQIYKSVDFDDTETTSAAVHRWLCDDLALGRCKDCPPPVTITPSTNS